MAVLNSNHDSQTHLDEEEAAPRIWRKTQSAHWPSRLFNWLNVGRTLNVNR
jgi:hypothetical protein